MMGLLLLGSIFFLFFYLIPFLIGYVLGKHWRVARPNRAGWMVMGFYAAWMVVTWLQEGYAPVSFAKLIAQDSQMARTEIYYSISHILLILLTLMVIYRGAARGAQWGFSRPNPEEPSQEEGSLG